MLKRKKSYINAIASPGKITNFAPAEDKRQRWGATAERKQRAR